MIMRSVLVASLSLVAAMSASAQSSHTINLGELSPDVNNVLQPGGSGFELRTFNPPLTYTTAPGVIDASEAYVIEFIPFVTALGTPLQIFTAAFELDDEGQPSGTPFPLRGAINQFGDFIPDVELYLFDGAIENPGGALPTNTLVRTFDISGQPIPGFPFKYTYTVTINADRSITVTFQDVNLSFAGPLTIVNAPFTATIPIDGVGNVFFGPSTMTIRTATLPQETDIESEFRFDNGLAPANGPARMAFLDDPRFADQPGDQDGNPVLQRVGNFIEPNPQYGFTEAQTDFGPASSFGIPLIGGQDPNVMQVSPARIDPINTYQNDRQIGIAVSPQSGEDQRPLTNDPVVDRFTMIWDIFVPTASWNQPTPVAFINFQEDNGTNSDQMGAADFRITRIDPTLGASSPQGIGINRLRVNGTVFDAASIVGTDFGPDRWMRVAITVDNEFAREAKIFINGTLIGQLGWADEIGNYVNPAFPNYRLADLDMNGSNTSDFPIDRASYIGWGDFPNPWHDFVRIQDTPIQLNTPQTNSNFVMFGDALGNGEHLYCANYYFAEFVYTPQQIAALGGPNAAGIILNCPLDRDNNGLAAPDVQAFVTDLNNGDDAANYNRDSETDAVDLFDILNTADENGC